MLWLLTVQVLCLCMCPSRWTTSYVTGCRQQMVWFHTGVKLSPAAVWVMTVCLSVSVIVCLSICPSVCLFVCRCIRPYVCLQVTTLKVKVKLQYLLQRFLHESDSRPEALYDLGSGSWLAWANDTAVHYAAIHCPRQQTIGPAVCSMQTYHHPNQPHYAFTP